MMWRSACAVATAAVLALAVETDPLLAAPAFRLDPSQSRVLSLSGLASDPDCHPATLAGRVVARQFDRRGTGLTGVTIEEGSGRRTFLNVDLKTDDLGMYQIGWINEGLNTLLRQGARVSLGIKLCGAAGRVMLLDSVGPAR